MKVAVCSLSQYTHVTEIIDLVDAHHRTDEVCYFLGFRDERVCKLLSDRGIPYRVLAAQDMREALVFPHQAQSTKELFTGYFFRHAELILPALLRELSRWKPDVILSNIRDYAGVTAGEVLDIPTASFGCASPVRDEALDPPFFGGTSREASRGKRRLMWGFHRKLHNELDAIYNEKIREPNGLDPIQEVSTHHSKALVLLWSIPSLSNKFSQDPPYVKYVGPLFLKNASKAADGEREVMERIAQSPRPRLFVTLGTFHSEVLVEAVLESLSDFPGTLVLSYAAAPTPSLEARLRSRHVIWSRFFHNISAVLNEVDAVVSVASGKTSLEALNAGKPLVGLPQQGEQLELAYRLEATGAGALPCAHRWEREKFVAAAHQVASGGSYTHAARRLQKEIHQSGGVEEAAALVRALPHG